MRAVPDAVHGERTALAAFVPARVEHEVVDDELASSLEQVGETDPAVGSLQGVQLVDLDHGQLAADGVHLVADVGEAFLGGWQLFRAVSHLSRGTASGVFIVGSLSGQSAVDASGGRVPA
jgi:hypothetical protein